MYIICVLQFSIDYFWEIEFIDFFLQILQNSYFLISSPNNKEKVHLFYYYTVIFVIFLKTFKM